MNSKREMLLSALAAANAQGLIRGDLEPARLMTPEETGSALRGRTGPEASFKGWCLCTDVHPRMHAALDSFERNMPCAVTQVQLGSGVECLMLLHRVANWQHRFCVPMVGRSVARWLDSIRGGAPLQVSLSARESEQALVSTLFLPPDVAAELPHPVELPADLAAFEEQAVAVALWGALQGAMDVADGMPAPENVCISLLIPPEMQAFAQAQAHRRGGAMLA